MRAMLYIQEVHMEPCQSFLMKSSPLCIGLNNGDGDNSLGHCIAGAVLNGSNGTFFAIPAVLGNLPWTGLYAFIRRKG